MWTVLESTDVRREVPKLPVQIREKYEAWKRVVREDGPRALRRVRGYRDEALAGNWRGYRSSRLSLDYRVIYFVERQQVRVDVERVSKHDYGR